MTKTTNEYSVMKKKIILSLPHMSGNERDFLGTFMDNERTFQPGNNVIGFENDLAVYLKEDTTVVALNSSTAALHLAFEIVGVQKGDEIICQALTHPRVINAIALAGAEAVLVDSEERTWNMDPAELEKAIADRKKLGKNIRAIVLSHAYGTPCNIEEIDRIAGENDIPLIDDASEALGATCKGQKCGTFGVMGVLSFGEEHVITTWGGGALVCTLHEQRIVAEYLAGKEDITRIDKHDAAMRYDYKMSEMVAGIGRGQMTVLKDRVKCRLTNTDLYRHALKDIEGVTFQHTVNNDYESSGWLAALRISSSKISVDKFIAEMDAAGVQTARILRPINLYDKYKSLPFYGRGVVNELYAECVCLPNGSALENEELSIVAEAAKRILA